MRETTSSDLLKPLPDRIRQLIGIVQTHPKKRRTMLYLVMYDIEDDRVRTLVARFLERKGCIRIQKSVFIAETSREVYYEIVTKLKEVNSLYENHDSIVIIPVSIDEVRAMTIIGKDLDLELIRDNPNLLFI